MIAGIVAASRAVPANPPPPAEKYLLVAHANSPYMAVYDADMTRLANPASLPPYIGQAAAVSADQVYFAVGFPDAPRFHVYKRTGSVLAKLANPATLPPNGVRGLAWTKDGATLAVAHGSGTGLSIYTLSADTLTYLTVTGIVTSTSNTFVAWSDDGVYMAVCAATTLRVYKRSGSNFTDLGVTSGMTGTGYGCAWSPDGVYLAVTNTNSPTLRVFKRTGDSFSPLTDPTVTAGVGVPAWNHDGSVLVTAHTSTPYIGIYSRSGDTLTKLSNPVSLPAGPMVCCDFSQDGLDLVLSGNTTSPYMAVYSTDTWAKKAAPASPPGGNAVACAYAR